MKGTDLALSDPLKWAEDVALPAMKAKGVNVDDRMELTKALATMFRNSNSNMWANSIMQVASRSRLHKDQANINQAGTLDEIYQRNLGTDPTVAITALTSSLDNLMTAASSPAMKAAAEGLTALATAAQTVALFAKDNPAAALTGGTVAAGGALAGAGWLSYQIMNGFGLGTSATALTGAAASLDAAALKLGGGSVLGGTGTTGGAVAGGSAAIAGAVATAVTAIGMALSAVATDQTLKKTAQQRADDIKGGGNGALASGIVAGSKGELGKAPSADFGPLSWFYGKFFGGGSGGSGAGSSPLEATVKPDQIQAAVKPDQVSAKIEGQATVLIKVEGSGAVANTSSSGNIVARDAGTSMGSRAGNTRLGGPI